MHKTRLNYLSVLTYDFPLNTQQNTELEKKKPFCLILFSLNLLQMKSKNENGTHMNFDGDRR